MSDSAIQNKYLVNDLSQLEANVDRLITGIEAGGKQGAAYANLVQAGVSFYPFQYGNQLAFAPSRFIGYKENDLARHQNLVANGVAHGSYTNKRIDRIVGSQSRPDAGLEAAFLDYCQMIGVEPFKKARKYWTNVRIRKAADSRRSAILDIDAVEYENDDPEYQKRMRGSYVRDQKVREAVLNRAQGICEFGASEEKFSCSTFRRPDGQPYLETHHIIKLSEQGPDKVSNVNALCANHHREAHFGERWKELQDEFQSIISKVTN